MDNRLKKNYQKEYNEVKLKIESRVQSGKEREELLSDLYTLYYTSQEENTSIEQIYNGERTLFINEIIEGMPLKKHYKMTQVVSIILLVIVSIITVIFGYAFILNINDMRMGENIGGATGVTEMSVSSNGIYISAIGMIIFLIITIISFQHYRRKSI